MSKARSLANRANDIVSVLDFGARGDGVTDDTAAIQAALNTGKAVSGVPGDTYLIGPLTQSTNDQFITFEGCNLKRINASSHAAMLTLNGNRVTVSGGRWDGNKANQSGTVNDQYGHAAVTIVGDYCTVKNVESFDSWGIGIKGSNCSFCNVNNNRCLDANLYGIYVEGIVANEYGNEIVDNFCSSTGIAAAHGVYLSGSNTYVYNQYRWKVARNVCVGSTSSPTGIGITTRAIYGLVSENITVGYTMGVSADSATRTVISNNNISDTAGSSDYGIELNAGYNTVTGNVIRNANYGICISGTISAQSYNNINGNLIENSTRGIFVQATSNPARYLNISGNTIVNTASSSGIYLQGDAKYSHISANNFVGPGSGVSNGRAVFLDSVGSNVSIIGNRMSGWERACGLYSASALTYTDITFNENDCTQDIGGGVLTFLTVEGSAVAGTRITQMWNNSNNGVDYNVIDKATNRILMWSGSFSTPESNWTAGVGSLFINLNGGAGTTFFVKQSGTGNTGWSGK